jgi:hypothetical protein
MVQIASKLKVLVETLIVAPQGNRPKMEKTIEYMKSNAADDVAVIEHMTQLATHVDQSRRYFALGFRDSDVRVVFPAADDPLRYEQQIIARAGTIDVFDGGNPQEQAP